MDIMGVLPLQSELRSCEDRSAKIDSSSNNSATTPGRAFPPIMFQLCVVRAILRLAHVVAPHTQPYSHISPRHLTLSNLSISNSMKVPTIDTSKCVFVLWLGKIDTHSLQIREFRGHLFSSSWVTQDQRPGEAWAIRRALLVV